MKELESVLKVVSDGLKTLAKGVEAIAEKVDEAAKAKSPVSTSRKRPSTATKKVKTAKKPVKKAANKKVDKAVTASDQVLGLIARSKKGVGMAVIIEKTGFGQKKVANIIYRLRKQGKIKSVSKGVYAKL
jgi:hypothetical protein